MAKKMNAEDLQEAGDIMDPIEPTAPVSELDKANAKNMMLESRLKQLEARIERSEFAGANKNRQRIWDEQNAKDDNTRYASLPSLDGKDPIIDWAAVKGNRSYVDANGYARDEQSWTLKTKSGHEQRIAVEEVPSLLSGNGIPVRINNWKAFREEVEAIDELKQRYQRSTSKMSAIDLKAMLEEIRQRDGNVTVNVTLSEDLGKTFLGETFDVPAKLLNAYR